MFRRIRSSSSTAIAGLTALSILLTACGSSTAPASTSPSGAQAASAKPAASGPVVSAKPAASGANAPSSGLIKVKTAYSQVTASQGVLFVAVERKFFERYGLDVSASQVGGTQQVPALQAGELEFGTPGGNEVITANAGGVPLVMIAASTNTPVLSLYGAKGITDVKQLAGKSVAVTSPGSATDAAAQLFLQHYGLDKQVERQAAGTSQAVLAVVLQGGAAGGLFAPPTSVKAEQSGLKELINGPKLGIPFVQAGTAVTRQFLKSKPDVVKRYLQGYYSAWKFATDRSNEAAVEQTIAKWTKSDMKTAKIGYDYLLPAWQQKGMPMVSLDGLKSIAAISANPKAKDVNLSEVIDNALLEAIAAGR